MKKCKRCNIYVKDQSNLCPLCKELLTDLSPEEKSTLASDSTADCSQTTESDDHGMYPDIEFNMGTFHLLRRIFTFLAVITAVVLFVINYATYDRSPVLWSLISVAAIGYGMVTVYYSILRNSNLAAKILVQTIGAGILCIIIDNVVGYSGWSINYVVPALIILSNLSIMLLMIVNPMNRRTYFMYQLTITIFSIVSFILCFTPLMTQRELAFIAGILCAVNLVGSIIFGDKGFHNELIRRFHI